MTPTQRSLKLLRSRGYLVAVVEKWNVHVKIRQDLFGFADLLCVAQDTVLLVQTTSGPHVAARIAKIRSLPAADLWLQSPNRQIHVHGWSRRGPRGKRKLWTCREEQLRRA